jgi:uncharacterized protein
VSRRQLVWRGLEEWLAEACEVTLDGPLVAWGTQLGAQPHPYRIEYVLITGSNWSTQRLYVIAHDPGEPRLLDLRRADDGTWTANGDPVPEVEGAIDCDLEWSPLTNFMPARRLGAEPVDHLMAFVTVPGLEVVASPQRYEPIDRQHVRYVSLDSDFVSELELDDDGFVIRYPRLAELVPSAARA